MENQQSKKKKLVMPDAFIIIFSIVTLAAIATYFVPAGSYEREESGNITTVVPGSYSTTEQNPANVLDLFKSIQLGMIESADIIFLIFIVGGIIHIIESTGAINAGIHTLLAKTRGRYMLVIASVSAVFGVLASVGVVAHAVIAFTPIGIALARSLKLDAITGVAMVYLGFYSGMIAGIFDPYILGLAQTIAELPLFSGMVLRIFVFLAMITLTIVYTTRYAKKIKNNPKRSIMAGKPFGNLMEEAETDPGEETNAEFTFRQKLVLFTFVAFIAFFVFGAFTWDWSINELVGIFLIMGIVISFVAKITPNEFMRRFIKGAQAITYGALVVGVARAVVVILEDGVILDTIVNAALAPLGQTSLFIGAQLLFVFNMLFNLLVTSGPGQAAIIMPVMVPIADVLGLTRQTGTLIMMLGDGFTNIIAPTSGVLMAVLAVGGVPWKKWIRFAFPLLLMWIVVGIVVIGYAVLTGYGPF